MTFAILIAKFAFLSVAIVYGTSYIGRVIRGHQWSDFQAWALGLSSSAFITLQWLL